MKQRFIKILSFAVLLSSNFHAQTFNNLFRTKDRPDNLEDFDLKKFSYGFYLAANNFDYKMVLSPVFGMDGNQNLVESKTAYSFGAGLIGKMRLNEYLDLRIEPGLHFVQRDLTFNTFDHNSQYAGGTTYNLPFTPILEPGEEQIKKIVKSEIIDLWDHAVLVNGASPHKELGVDLEQKGHKVIFCNYQPTCENMLYDIAEKIKAKLSGDVNLAYLKLHETENSYGEWFAEDN